MKREGSWTIPYLPLASLLVMACGSAADPGDSEPSFDYYAPSSGGITCIAGGDPSNATWNLDACLTESGFFGQDFLTSLEATTFVEPNPGWLPRHVYFVHEVRWAPFGAAYRLEKAVSYTGPSGTVVDVGSFSGRLVSGLAALAFQGFVGACPDDPSYEDPAVCAEFAFAGGSMHDEPALCVWNDGVGADGSAGAFCANGPFSGVIRQRLPLALFSGEKTLLFCGSPSAGGGPAPCYYSVVLAVTGTIPDEAIAEYRWSCAGSDPVATSEPTVNLPFCGSWGEVSLTAVDVTGAVGTVTVRVNDLPHAGQ